MKVKILVSMHGPTTHREPGQIHDLEDSEAISLIAHGYAVRFDPPIDVAPIHSTSLAPPEAAVLPSPKPRRLRANS